jgi:hypothetical protein
MGRGETMTVADLIAVLLQHNRRAMVVLWDHSGPPAGGPHLSRLRREDVQAIALGGYDLDGLWVLDEYNDEQHSETTPRAGVVLGSR